MLEESGSKLALEIGEVTWNGPGIAQASKLNEELTVMSVAD
jgi:hypothetical protein